MFFLLLLFFQVDYFPLINQSFGKIPPTIKVSIGKNLKEIDLTGHDLKRYNYINETELQHHGLKTVRFNCLSPKNSSSKNQSILAKVSSPSRLIRWGKNVYKGEMKVYGFSKNGRCGVINHVNIEDYLKTLLSKEMHGSWPIEALKAQAVAARSYAYFKIKKRERRILKNLTHTPYDLESSEKYQVSGHIYDETSSTVKAIRETYGEILIDPKIKKISPIFYHSKCGGRTTTPDYIWGNKVKGAVSVECPYCQGHGKGDWQFSFNKNEFKNYIKLVVKKYYPSIKWGKHFNLVYPDSEKNDYLYLKMGKKVEKIKKIHLRRILGRKVIPGHIYSILNLGNKIILKGKGNGHGVGLCQFGAYDLAKKGIKYRDILAYYFPRYKIVKVYKK